MHDLDSGVADVPKALIPVSGKLRQHFRNLTSISPREAIPYLTSRLLRRLTIIRRKLTGRQAPTRRDDDTLDDRMERILRWFLGAAEDYEARPYDGRLWLFRAKRRTDWAGTANSEHANGWEPLAGGGVEIHEVDSEHMELFKPPGLVDLARKFADAIRSARSS